MYLYLYLYLTHLIHLQSTDSSPNLKPNCEMCFPKTTRKTSDYFPRFACCSFLTFHNFCLIFFWRGLSLAWFLQNSNNILYKLCNHWSDTQPILQSYLHKRHGCQFWTNARSGSVHCICVTLWNSDMKYLAKKTQLFRKTKLRFFKRLQRQNPGCLLHCSLPLLPPHCALLPRCHSRRSFSSLY